MKKNRRLNLLSFPKETNSIFAMLILATLLPSVFMGIMFPFLFGPESLLAETDSAPLWIILPAAMITFIVVSAISFILYVLHPRKIRRKKNIVLIGEQDVKVTESVREIAKKIGVREPNIEMPPKGSGGTGGQVFGFFKPYRIRLDDGLRSWQKYKRKLFDAIVLHELSHIASGDIWRTYLSESIWKTLTWLLVIPTLSGVFFYLVRSLIFPDFFSSLPSNPISTRLLTIVFLVFQAGFAIGILAILRARLLRTREYYADWHASNWGASDGLRQILQELSEHEKAEHRTRPLQFHPTAEMRLNVLDGNNELMRVSNIVVFLAGVLLGFMFVGAIIAILGTFELVMAPFLQFGAAATEVLPALFSLLIVTIGWLILIMVLVVPIAWLLSGVLGVQVQKQAAHDLADGQRGWKAYLRLAIPAFIFVFGIEAGLFGTPFSPLVPQSFQAWLLETFVTFPVLFFSSWCYLSMTRFISLRLFASQIGTKLLGSRTSYLKGISLLWLIFFFVPGFILSRPLFLAENEIQQLLAIWCGLSIIFAPVLLIIGWWLERILFERKKHKCPACRNPISGSLPVLQTCESCGTSLGEWLFKELPDEISGIVTH
jgi:Zn-dependent protease with chaperone function